MTWTSDGENIALTAAQRDEKKISPITGFKIITSKVLKLKLKSTKSVPTPEQSAIWRLSSHCVWKQSDQKSSGCMSHISPIHLKYANLSIKNMALGWEVLQ